MSIAITLSTPWAFARHLLPAATLERLIEDAAPAPLPSIATYTLNQLASILEGEWAVLAEAMGINEVEITTGQAVAVAKWVKVQMEGVGAYYDNLPNRPTPEEKRAAERAGSLPFLAGCAFRAVKYFALSSVEAAQNTRLADIMLMDKGAAIDAAAERYAYEARMKNMPKRP